MIKLDENCEIGNTGKKLKDVIENDSGWVKMSLDSNFSANVNMPPRYRKIENQVFLAGLLYLRGTMPDDRCFTTMPEEYRPKGNTYLNAYYSGTNENANVILLRTGKFQASNKMTESSSYFLSLDGLSYFVD